MSDRQCNHVDAYIGGWLPDSQRRGFEDHLGQCPACRAEIGTQRELDGLLTDARAHLEPVPDALIQRLRQARPEHRPWQAGKWVYTGLAAAAAIAVLVTALQWERRGPVSWPGEAVPTAPVADQRAGEAFTATQQLALLMSSRPKPGAAVPWLQPVIGPGPGLRAPAEPAVSPAGDQDERPPPSQAPSNVLHGPLPPEAHAIGVSRSLGQRKLQGFEFAVYRDRHNG